MIKGSHTEYMQTGRRIAREFYTRDVLDVAPALIGKNLVIRLRDDSFAYHPITDVEAYRGYDDKACHASRGRTARTEVMFREGGYLYLYLIYGMYWMLNIVTGSEGDPQAVLIRGLENIPGPGKLTKALSIDRSYYGEDLVTSARIWLDDTGLVTEYKTGPRIGIDYAGDYWKSRPWRYFL